jgi:hypothetical protein
MVKKADAVTAETQRSQRFAEEEMSGKKKSLNFSALLCVLCASAVKL